MKICIKFNQINNNKTHYATRDLSTEISEELCECVEMLWLSLATDGHVVNKVPNCRYLNPH